MDGKLSDFSHTSSVYSGFHFACSGLGGSRGNNLCIFRIEVERFVE